MRIALLVLTGIAVLAPPAVSQARPQARPGIRREIPWLDFSPHGVWRGRARQVRANRARLLAARQFSALNARLLAPGIFSTTTVSGTLVEPVVLFKYQDTPAGEIVGDTTAYDNVLFASTPPNLRPYTVRTYYEQLSSGQMTITGKALGFVTLDSSEVAYTGAAGTCTGNPYGTTNCNGLFSGDAYARMQQGLREALQKLDSSVDWTQFTSHGDTLDLVVFAHPAKDGACGGYGYPNPTTGDATNNHIWSHRSTLAVPYQTHSIRLGGGPLTVVDYIIESAVGGASSCDTTRIMPVGTVAHETGHGFDLPDLYDTSPTETSEGVGEYSLMGSGNYSSPLSPSRFDAWSLSQLGWVNVVPLAANGTHQFGGAPVSDTVFYVRAADPNPRGEYFLLENRQPLQSDSAMIRLHGGGGLLVWHVDSTQMANHGFSTSNNVNEGPIHGLEVVQADGRWDLDLGISRGGNRGDAGDPFPGATNALTFVPSRNADGAYAGFEIDSIRQLSTTSPMSMAFRLQFVPYVLSAQAVLSRLLKGTGLTQTDLNYLDGVGNRNGQFDVGDFLAWAKANGVTPSSP